MSTPQTAPHAPTLADLPRLERELAQAREKLSRMHEAYMTTWHTGSVTRARTTTFNANAAWVREEIHGLRDTVKALRVVS